MIEKFILAAVWNLDAGDSCGLLKTRWEMIEVVLAIDKGGLV